MRDTRIIIAGMMTGKKYICSDCGNGVLGFKDRDSAREYKVSGLCQTCQDSYFGSDESPYGKSEFLSETSSTSYKKPQQQPRPVHR